MPKKKIDTSGMKDMFAMAEVESLENRVAYINEGIEKLKNEIKIVESELDENRNDVEARNDYVSLSSDLRFSEKTRDDIYKQIEQLKQTYNI